MIYEVIVFTIKYVLIKNIVLRLNNIKHKIRKKSYFNDINNF